MAVSIESHPQRDRIIEAIMRGDDARSIAKWVKPRVSHVTIWRYARNNVAEALRKRGEVAKVLRENEILRSTIEQNGDTKALALETSREIAADSITARIAKKYERYDRVISQAEDSKDFKSVAALDAAETRTMTLQAQLEGRLQPQQSAGTVVQIAVMTGTADQQKPAIDVSIAEVGRRE